MSYEIIEVAPKGPHARRRFARHLNAIGQLLSDATASSSHAFPGQTFFQNNGRNPMFMLEALGRVYEELLDESKLFARIRLESKIVEDALGQVDFWNATSRHCQAWQLPAGVQELARERYVEACGRTWAWIESQDWVASRYHAEAELLSPRFTRKLKKVDWKSPNKEAKALKKWLTKELHSIQAKVLELDLRQIEEGVHKARREVRWVSIYFRALEGAFVLDRDAAPPENWECYLSKEIVGNPYNTLPEPEPGDVPISVPAPLLYALSYAIDRLGVIKDRAQWTETVRHLVELSGEKASLPKLMGENYLEDAEASKQAAEVIEQVFVKDEMLLKLAEAINEQG